MRGLPVENSTYICSGLGFTATAFSHILRKKWFDKAQVELGKLKANKINDREADTLWSSAGCCADIALPIGIAVVSTTALILGKIAGIDEVAGFFAPLAFTHTVELLIKFYLYKHPPTG